MKKNILLVDDNPADLEFTCYVLKSCEIEHEVFIGRDGEEALHLLENEAAIDLVLLDLKLPKVDGFDVLARAGADERLARIPVIVLSTSALDSDVTRAAQLGAAGYIVKSIEFAEFRRALKAELSKHLVC
jgi:CheY-like chemotaxis protein